MTFNPETDPTPNVPLEKRAIIPLNHGTEQFIKDVRWLMEIAYRKAWSDFGNAEQRDKWIEILKRNQDIIGVPEIKDSRKPFTWI